MVSEKEFIKCITFREVINKMCTAITFATKDHYFGRNLDLDFSYNETVTITPRNFKFPMRKVDDLSSHYAMIGMATVVEDYPLYYDAINEAGLGMAGLNFPDNAHYFADIDGKNNIASFEMIPYILGQAKTVDEAKKLLENVSVSAEVFSADFPTATLHWIIADKEKSIVVESTKEGLNVYDNPVGVMTNNPPFPIQMYDLNDYYAISAHPLEHKFGNGVSLHEYSRGMAGLGLPGDLSSKSRFVRAVFTKYNSMCDDDELSSINQFFKILGSVEQVKGLCEVTPGKYEYTIYSSCMNQDKGIFYYTTYGNSDIHAIDMHKVDLDGDKLSIYKLNKKLSVSYDN